ncbi:MAG TPA: LruC domain-containing protein [Myxococcota bacterium]|nr:LruC domain-containing protein [Myxococcota bacterium]HQK52344.1 LruC domain-containing protein [Myxococcota bacterium]
MKTRILILPVLLGLGLSARAITLDNKGKVVWTFLKMPYASNYDASGIPKTIDEKKTFPVAFLTRLATTLPEMKDVRKTNPGLITDDAGANLILKKDADVYVTFLHEGAGYQNAFGFFTFDPSAPPTRKQDVREVILFPNASFYNSGGSSAGLRSGDTVRIGRFTKGTAIGFVVVANGFDSKTGVATNATGGPPGGDWTFYTLQGLNPEPAADLRRHTVLLHDTETGTIVLGMEDLLRSTSGCDHDFNDILFTISSVPGDAFDTEDIVVLPDPEDRDNDGVKDGVDDYPDDPDRTFDQWTPSPTADGTLVFEDAWPWHGDYDFNDLVLSYRFHRVLNKDGKVVDLVARFQVLAGGSEFRNGLAFHLPGIPTTALKTATLSTGGGAPVPVTPEAGQPDLVFPLSQDLFADRAPKATCLYLNTEPGCSEGPGTVFELDLTFQTPQSNEVLGVPPYDPFLFRSDRRGHEIHLVDHAPTARVDMSLFRTGEDDSVAAQGRWYRSICNLPWGLDLPVPWSWPLEGTEVSSAYPSFLDWVNSAGARSADWYLHPDPDAVWTAP